MGSYLCLAYSVIGPLQVGFEYNHTCRVHNPYCQIDLGCASFLLSVGMISVPKRVCVRSLSTSTRTWVGYVSFNFVLTFGLCIGIGQFSVWVEFLLPC